MSVDACLEACLAREPQSAQESCLQRPRGTIPLALQLVSVNRSTSSFRAPSQRMNHDSCTSGCFVLLFTSCLASHDSRLAVLRRASTSSLTYNGALPRKASEMASLGLASTVRSTPLFSRYTVA